MDALLHRRIMMSTGGIEPPEPPESLVFYDRLIFDGTAYIDTDVIPPSGASFRLVLGNETGKRAQRVFAVGCNNDAMIGVVYNSNTTSTRRYFSYYYGTTSSISSSLNLDFTTTEYRFFLTARRIGIGTNVTMYTSGSNSPSSGLLIGTNTEHTGNPFTGEIGTMQIYGNDTIGVASYDGFDNYTPQYTFRPCTVNGEAGLWCVEKSKFYGNSANGGTLTVRNIE